MNSVILVEHQVNTNSIIYSILGENVIPGSALGVNNFGSRVKYHDLSLCYCVHALLSAVLLASLKSYP